MGGLWFAGRLRREGVDGGARGRRGGGRLCIFMMRRIQELQVFLHLRIKVSCCICGVIGLVDGIGWRLRDSVADGIARRA